MGNTIIIEGTWEVEVGTFWKPAVEVMDQDSFRMGTRLGDNMTLLHQGHDYKTMELVHHDLPMGLKIRAIKRFDNEALVEWLSNNYERGGFRDSMAEKATAIETCPECDNDGVYYIPFKRTNTDWGRNPLELHYSVCSQCNWFQLVK